jgi:hypothetical protein
LVYLSTLLFPNSYIILFWEFYFLPFFEHAQTNLILLVHSNKIGKACIQHPNLSVFWLKWSVSCCL